MIGKVQSGSCVSCGSTESRQPYLGDLERCPTCGHVAAADIPDDSALIALYDEGYFHGDEYFDYVADRRAAEANFRRNLRALARYSGGGRLLDVGCAYGYFLNLAQSRWAVEGVDITEAGVSYAQKNLGVNARLGDFIELDFAPSSFDVVCLWDTIEHLSKPDEYIARSAELLRPRGILALTTGDIGSKMARRQGRSWRLIHPPTHVHYFTQCSIRRLLERHGFQVEEIRYEPQYRTVRMAMYGIVGLRFPRLRSLVNWAVRLPGMGIVFPLNLHDIMFVIARRQPSSSNS